MFTDSDKVDKIVEPMNVDQYVEDSSQPIRVGIEKAEDHREYLHNKRKGINFKETCEASSTISMCSGEYDSGVSKPNKLQGVISTKDNMKVSSGPPREQKKKKSLNSHVGSVEEHSDRTAADSSSVIERNVEIEEDVCGHDKSVECSEQTDIQTQGSIEDLHHSSSLSPLYPALALCSHSVECLVSKLTSSVWYVIVNFYYLMYFNHY